jgi:hypothetical protein
MTMSRNPRTLYLRSRRSRLRHPSRAAELRECRCLADWVAIYSQRAAAVLRGAPKFPPAHGHVETQSAQHPPRKARGGRFSKEAR